MAESILAVCPTAITEGADAVRRTRDDCLIARRPYLDQLEAAARSLAGWPVGAALANLEERWYDDTGRLAERLTDLAGRLDEAAAAYQAAERSSTQRFREFR